MKLHSDLSADELISETAKAKLTPCWKGEYTTAFTWTHIRKYIYFKNTMGSTSITKPTGPQAHPGYPARAPTAYLHNSLALTIRTFVSGR